MRIDKFTHKAQEAIQQALANPREIDDALVDQTVHGERRDALRDGERVDEGVAGPRDGSRSIPVAASSRVIVNRYWRS